MLSRTEPTRLIPAKTVLSCNSTVQKTTYVGAVQHARQGFQPLRHCKKLHGTSSIVMRNGRVVMQRATIFTH